MAVDDLDRADAGPQRVALQEAAPGADRQRRVVEVRAGRRPQARLVDLDLLGERREALGADRDPADGDAPRAEARADGDAPGTQAVVAQRDAVGDRRLARGAREVGPDDDRVEVDVVDLAQVDLAQQAAVVPPAARRLAHDRQPGGREVGLLAARVDPDDQVVDAAALEQPGRQADLERQVGAAVLADRLAVEPDLRAVVDRLEAHHPRRPLGGRRELEVLAVPPDPAEERLRAVVADVPRVGDRDLLPAGDPGLELGAALVVVELEQPGAVHQVAAGGTGLVERLVARRGDDRLGARRDGDREQGGNGDGEGANGHAHTEAF